MDVAQARAVLTLEDSQFQRGVKRADQQFDQLTKNVQRSGTRASSAIGASLAGLAGRFAVGGAIAAGFGAAIKLAGDYEQALNVLGAVSGATAGQMRDLARLAEDLGGDLSLPATSATDAAQAMQELAKAGLSVEDTMGAARGVLQLSAAAGVDAARAAEITANALNAFQLSGDKAVKVADLLAATANASSAEISDLGNSMRYAGTAFAEAGQSIESLTTALGLLANAGLKGEVAGTALRGIMASLTAPSKEATAVLRALGISIFDNEGKMRKFRDIIDQFSRKLGPVTQQQRQWALQQIFGREAANAANIVLTKGVQRYDEMAKAVTRSGAAADLAAAKNKGLKGAFDGLRSAIETAAVKAVRPFQGDLESLVRATAKAVESIGNAFPRGIENAAGEIRTAWGDIKSAFTDGFLSLSDEQKTWIEDSLKKWSGYFISLHRKATSAEADAAMRKLSPPIPGQGILRRLLPGQQPISPQLQQIGQAAANRAFAGMGGGVEQAQRDAKERMTKVGEAIPTGLADGITRGAPKANAALAKLMKDAGGGRAGKLSPEARQELSLAQELAGARQQLAVLLAGEGNIAGEVAAKFNLLSAARRGELVTVLQRIEAEQKNAAARRSFKEELDRTNAAIRDATSYGGTAKLRLKYPDIISDDQIKRLDNAQQTLKGLEERNRQTAEETRRAAEANERLKETIESIRLEGMRYRTVQLYGEINRQALAIDNFRKSFEELDPDQQNAITQLFNYRQAVEVTKQATEEFTRASERRIRAHREEQELLERETNAMADFQRSLQDARREQEQQRTDRFAEGLQRLSDEARQRAEEYQYAIESVADGLKGVFENAFLDLNKGFSGFITSIIDGFSRMLQQLAAQYLASQLVKLLARSLGVDIGGVGGSVIGTIFGGERAPARQHGGYVGAGKPYMVGEQGRELFIPRSAGNIVPMAAGAGGGNITINFHVSTPDVDGFRRNQPAMIGDALRQAATQRRRDGY